MRVNPTALDDEHVFVCIYIANYLSTYPTRECRYKLALAVSIINVEREKCFRVRVGRAHLSSDPSQARDLIKIINKQLYLRQFISQFMTENFKAI